MEKILKFNVKIMANFIIYIYKVYIYIKYIYIYIYIYIYKVKVGNLSQGSPESSLFNSCYTEV